MIENKQTPLVSVAMVSYNSEKYVRFAIDSILASSYTNFELIISDDCSTDSTWDIIQSYNDSRIIASKNEINLREYSNREKCIHLAKGEYFIFIDGDDMIYPWGIEFIINEIEKFPEAGMALAMQWRNYIFYPYLASPKENMLFTYFGNSFLDNSFSQTLFKTKILKRALPFPEGIISGDSYIKKKISITNSVLLTNGPIAWWRQTPGQASEQLSKGYIGFFDLWRTDMLILNDDNITLSESEINTIWSHKHHILKRNIIKQLLKLNFRTAYNLFKLSNIKKLFGSKKKKEPIYKANASATNPLKID
jgi:glycosyltransferase involved in cell wall biosynthesis